MGSSSSSEAWPRAGWFQQQKVRVFACVAHSQGHPTIVYNGTASCPVKPCPLAGHSPAERQLLHHQPVQPLRCEWAGPGRDCCPCALGGACPHQVHWQFLRSWPSGCTRHSRLRMCPSRLRIHATHSWPPCSLVVELRPQVPVVACMSALPRWMSKMIESEFKHRWAGGRVCAPVGHVPGRMDLLRSAKVCGAEAAECDRVVRSPLTGRCAKRGTTGEPSVREASTAGM